MFRSHLSTPPYPVPFPSMVCGLWEGWGPGTKKREGHFGAVCLLSCSGWSPLLHPLPASPPFSVMTWNKKPSLRDWGAALQPWPVQCGLQHSPSAALLHLSSATSKSPPFFPPSSSPPPPTPALFWLPIISPPFQLHGPILPEVLSCLLYFYKFLHPPGPCALYSCVFISFLS